jgi:hypothetical protein
MGAIVIRTRYDEGTESAKVATSDIIPYRLYDVTGRINPRMDYAFCLLQIEEF